jgi:cell division control protein 6
MDGNDRILPEYVRIAGSFDRPMEERKCTDEEIRELPLHEKILLLAVSRTLIKSQDVLVRMGKVEEEYRAICEEYGIPPYGHTAVWRRIRSLGERGFIELRKSGKGYRGQTTLIGMNAFPAKSLEERVRQLIESAIIGEDMNV